MFKTLRNFALMGAAALSLSACGESIEIPTGYVAKLITVNGVSEDIIRPGKFWKSAMCWVCDSVTYAETTSFSHVEKMDVTLKDKVPISFDIRGSFDVAQSDEGINFLFTKVSATQVNSSQRVIKTQTLYDVYVKSVIRDSARATVANYTLDELLENRAAIGIEIENRIRERLTETPVLIRSIGLGTMEIPTAITDEETARRTEEAGLRTAAAREARKLREATANLAIEEANQAVELKQAETILLTEEVLDGLTSRAFVQRRALEALTIMAEKGSVFYITPESVGNPETLIGLPPFK